MEVIGVFCGIFGTQVSEQFSGQVGFVDAWVVDEGF